MKKILNVSFMELAILVFLIVELNYDWNGTRILHWGALGLLVLGHLLKNTRKVDFEFKDYSLWMAGILLMSIVSLGYSSRLSVSISMLKNLIIIFIAFFIIRNYMTDEKKIKNILNLYVIAVFVNMIYVMTNIDMSIIGNVQIGDDAIAGWNGNTIGLMSATAGVLCVYMIIQNKSFIGKLFYSVITVFFVYMFLYTGSRKSIVLFIACLVVMLFVKNPRKILRNIIIAALLLYITYMLVMKVESVYNVLGVRLEGLIAAITGEGEVDNSTMLRQIYINNGIKWIKESFVIGYGLDCYRVLNGPATGHSTYSHNNFIEMAINWGILGFVYYYSAFILIIKRFFVRMKRDMLPITIFALFVGNLCLHYGMVTYQDIWQNLLLCLGFAIVSIRKENFEREEEI